MSNVRLTWALPAVSARQKPIQYTEISVRVDPGLPWTVQDIVDYNAIQELLFIDVPPGEQFYQAVVFDIDGRAGNPVETSVAVPFDPPGEVSTLTAVVEG